MLNKISGAILAAGVLAAGAAVAVDVDASIPAYTKVSGVDGSLKSIGSDTLNNLMTLWAEGYSARYPNDLLLVERIEWGPFIGRMVSLTIAGSETQVGSPRDPKFVAAHEKARANWRKAKKIEKNEIGAINAGIERGRLNLKRIELKSGMESAGFTTPTIWVLPRKSASIWRAGGNSSATSRAKPTPKAACGRRFSALSP